MKKTSAYLKQMKAAGRKIAMLTCYDCPTARILEAAGIDVILVGDSVGTNVLGYEHERQVTMADMVHHVKAVRRGVSQAYLLADMPYKTYEDPATALQNAQLFVSLGADGVKLEGFRPEIIRYLTGHGIEVCGHLGLNPQIHEKKGLRAKTAAEAIGLIENAVRLQEAGAALMILEMIPEEVGRLVTERLVVPTIGIGAGRYTDGQVLIFHDLLGIHELELRHVTRYEDIRGRCQGAVRRYAEDVAAGRFPGDQNVRHLKPEELAALAEWATRH
jgi:3-methyl-2-oxobutanoate hydroxymethyltransferase